MDMTRLKPTRPNRVIPSGTWYKARVAGRGGVTAVATATRVARSTIGRGLAELRLGRDVLGGRVRRPGRWTQAVGGDATWPVGGFGRAGAIGHPRRSRGRLAVGQQEPTPPRSRADRARLHRRPDAGRPTAAPARLQPAGQPQDPRGHKPPRPRRPIRIHQRAGEGLADRRPAGDLVRHEEERARDVKNGGRELRPKGQPEAVRVHDFALPELGKVAPYGVYDIA